MGWLPPLLIPLLIIGGIVYLFMRRNGERARNAPLRGEIEAHVCFETILDRASVLGTGGFEGTRGQWIPVKGPKRLIVGTDAFMVSAPQALREFVFRGHESSIAFSKVPSRVVDRDWIVITGQDGGRQVQLAITHHNLPEVWQALAGTGAALMLRVISRALLATAKSRSRLQKGNSVLVHLGDLKRQFAASPRKRRCGIVTRTDERS